METIKHEISSATNVNKEILNWDITDFGGYIFQETKQHNPQHHPNPLQYHHSQSQPHFQPHFQQQQQQQQTSSQHHFHHSQSQSQSEESSAQSSSATTPLSLSQSNIRKPFSFDDQCALIIANQKLPRKLLEFYWDKCSIKICADGGANRLYTLATKLNQVNKWIPNYIKGDLDSLHEGVSDFYSKKGSTIILDPNQDTCDLQKCFELINDLEKDSGTKYRKIFILGGLGGSLSHEFANINTLFDHPDRKLVLSSKNNIAWLLNPNFNHHINCQTETKCSLIPLSSKVTDVTTTGLKWNLVKQSLNFGELISTSNVTLDTKVMVETSDPLIYIVDTNP